MASGRDRHRIEIADEVYDALAREAQAAGVSVVALASGLLAEALDVRTRDKPLRRMLERARAVRADMAAELRAIEARSRESTNDTRVTTPAPAPAAAAAHVEGPGQAGAGRQKTRRGRRRR